MGVGSGPKMVKTPSTSNEGEQQGAVESMHLFTLIINDANNETNRELMEHGGALIAGADDTYIIGSPAIMFVCICIHKERVALAGLKLNVSKTKAYVHKDFRNASYHAHCTGIEEGHAANRNGVTPYRLKVYGIPVGSDRYIKQFLLNRQQELNKIY